MSRIASAAVMLAIISSLATPRAVFAREMPATEKQKIEALIEHVEALEGAVFVRDDREYDAQTAARYLRWKWHAKEPELKTAGEFIEKVASYSSDSGEPYLIRLDDGDETTGAEYLVEELDELEKATGSGRCPGTPCEPAPSSADVEKFKLWALLLLMAAGR